MWAARAALAENDISIVTLSLADTTDFGIVRMIVSDHEKAREFENAQSMDVWFDYPLHVPDHRRVLAQCPYDGDSRSHDGSGRSRVQAREEKQRTLEEAFEAVSMGEDAVRIDDMAEYLGVSPKTVKRRIDESMHLERNDGYVRRKA